MNKNEGEPSLGGAKKKNGHKMDCGCHICENMKKKAQRGGYEEEAKRKEERRRGVPQKKNGHKRDCNCPICKNMRNAKRGNKGDDGNVTIANEIDYGNLDSTGGTRKRRRRSNRRQSRRRSKSIRRR